MKRSFDLPILKTLEPQDLCSGLSNGPFFASGDIQGRGSHHGTYREEEDGGAEGGREAQGGDVGALEPLVRAHYARSVRAAYLILRDRQAAEDVVQEAFARVPDRIGTFDGARPFGPWFSRTVVNGSVKAASRRERTASYYGGDAEVLISRVADPARGLHEHAEQAETQRRVWRALGQLPPAQRAVIVQRYYLGMTEAEMAGTADSPPGTIKSRLNAARGTLSKLLRPQFGAEPQERFAPAGAGATERRNGRG